MKKGISLVLVLALGLAAEVAKADNDNQPPIADAGSSRYAAKDPVQLDGTGSYDPDSSSPLSYAWQQVAGPSVAITDANTATPTISGFVQTDEIQECEFELVVGDGELTSRPDTVKVIIVPDFGENMLRLGNHSFDPDKPTYVFFHGGDCIVGLPGQATWASVWPYWLSKTNIIDFPGGYVPDTDGNPRTYYACGDMIIVYLSSVAPDYKMPIQTAGVSTGGQPAIDVGIRLNLTYQDARYAVNHVTFFDATGYCRDYSQSTSTFLTSSVDGELCWIDNYVGTLAGAHPDLQYPSFHPNVLNVVFDKATDSSLSWLYRHGLPAYWYGNSLTGSDMNRFNKGVVAGTYWSVAGPGKNLQLASTPGVETYKFTWYGDAYSGHMDFYDEAQYPGRLPEPVTLFVRRIPWLADDDPNGIVLTCLESQNAVNYQLLSGSDPYNVADYNVVADSNSPAAATAAMLPSSDTWWTIRVRDAHGSTIYADPIRVDSTSAMGPITAELFDFNRDFKLDMQDFSELAQHWRQYEPLVDIGPTPFGDGIVDFHDLAVISEYWLKEVKDPRLVAHWKLDETEGMIAYDSAGDKDGTLYNDPLWQPTGGKINGALEFDGIGDYVSTPFVLDPAEGVFSVFAWVKGDAPGQVIVSQTDSTGVGQKWLGTDLSNGKLMTTLTDGRRGTQPLVSDFEIIDGQWHCIGVVWDGFRRHLYIDGAEVAKDDGTLNPLMASDGGLYLGAYKDLSAGGFFCGMIDDVRIYNRAVRP